MPKTYKRKKNYRRRSKKRNYHAVPRWGGHQQEFKFVDESVGNVLYREVNDSLIDPSNDHLGGTAQGAGQSQRIGRVCYIRSIYIRGHVRIPSASAVENQGYFRVWLVLDTQTNLIQMPPNTFLKNFVGTGFDVDSMQNLDYSDRYKLLKSTRIKMPPRQAVWNGTSVETNDVNVPFTLFWKGNVKREHISTGAGVDQVTTNSFHILAIGSQDMHATSAIQYICRTRFTD